MWAKMAGRTMPGGQRTAGLLSMSSRVGSNFRLKRGFVLSAFQRKKSLYEILEVDVKADAKTIKKAFMKKGSM